VSVTAAVVGLAVSLVLGVAAGGLSAARAARLDPVDALRQ
jgi:ABC-type antimicrobial peptide transport system permease subunit